MSGRFLYIRRQSGSRRACSGSFESVSIRLEKEKEEQERERDEDPLRIRRRYNVKGEELVLDARYTPVKRLGKGSSALVVLCRDQESSGKKKKKVAVKKVRDPFQDLVESQRLLREVQLLKHFNHPNVLSLLDIINPLSMEEYRDVYLVTEYMQSDLSKIIYSDKKLSEIQMAWIIYQTLLGLYHMHTAGVVHRDIKPQNILVNSDCSVKICDLGLARGFDNEEEKAETEMTEYVVTRWYRAPEVILSSTSYGPSVDVWSVGCVFGEMLLGGPLFQGENYIHQLTLIMSMIGKPKKNSLDHMTEDAKRFIQGVKVGKKTKLRKIFQDASKDAIKLLQSMLCFDPRNRITVEEALRHSFFSQFFDEQHLEEAECERWIFGVESMTRSVRSVRDLLFREIVEYRPYAFQDNPLPVEDDYAIARSRSRSSLH